MEYARVEIYANKYILLIYSNWNGNRFMILGISIIIDNQYLCICYDKIANDWFIIGVYEDQVTRIRQAFDGALDS